MKNICSLAALSLLMLGTSCSLEPMEMPNNEIFTRNFIKKFGLIDPNQTWNLAKEAEVTVIPDGAAKFVKVSGVSDGRYYTVAEITDVTERITIPVDVPVFVTDLKVEIDGKVFFTEIGGTVDATQPASRTYIDGNNSGGFEVSDTEDVQRFPAAQIYELFSLMPEGGKHNGNFPGNLEEPSIKTDFILNSGNTDREITIFPVYWNTCQTHELGVYYFTTANPNEESGANIVRIPFYKMQKAPMYENLIFVHTKHNISTVQGVTDEKYEYLYRGLLSTTSAVNAKYGTGNYHDNNLGEDVFYTMTPTPSGGSAVLYPDRTITENLLEYGDCHVGAGDYDENMYVILNGESKKLLCSDPQKFLGCISGDNYFWRVPVTSEGGHYYSNQFVIKLPKTFLPGETFTLSFKYKVADDTANGITASSFASRIWAEAGSTIGDIGTCNFTAGADWQTATFTYTVPEYSKNGVLMDQICFGLNKGNVYCFDDIEVTCWPFEPLYKKSDWRTGSTYWPLDENTWTETHRYIADGQESEPADIREYVGCMTKTTSHPKVDMSDAHLLVEKNGTLCTPLGDVENGRNVAFQNESDVSVLSKGIKVKIPANTRFGFYLHFKDVKSPYNEKYIYSEVKGNIEFLSKTDNNYGDYNSSKTSWAQYNADDREDRRKATYCAMFDQKYNGHSYTYLTFEDWTPGSSSGNTTNPVGDYDINDLAFLVENINIHEDVEQEKRFEYLICAEDLGIDDDFDFNDMIVGVDVLTIGSGVSFQKSVTFTALAAGGTLPLYLHFGDQVLGPEGNKEWHNWFGVTNTGEMINTINGKNFRQGKAYTVIKDSSFTLQGWGSLTGHGVNGSNGFNGIYITVYTEDGSAGVYDPSVEDAVRGLTVTPPQAGAAPQMFLITDEGTDAEGRQRNWQWAEERSPINVVFPRFNEWAKTVYGDNSGGYDSTKPWYKDKPASNSYNSHYTKRPK